MKRKRNSSDSEDETPKKITFHDEDEEDYLDETVSATDIDPDVMARHVEAITKILETQGKGLRLMRTSLVKIVEEYSHTLDDDSLDKDAFVKAYRKYFHLAVRKCNLDSSAKFVLDFLRGPESLEYFNKFPSKPPQVFHMYLKQNNIPYVIKDVPLLKERMEADPEGKAKAEKTIADLEKEYLDGLQAFLQHALSGPQREAVQQRIKIAKRKVEVKVPKTPKKKGAVKEEKTPYSLFCKVHREKYAHLTPEKQEKKLIKKFNKLTPDELEIFDKLAMS